MKQYNHLEIEKKWSGIFEQKYLSHIEKQIYPKELEFEFLNLNELSKLPHDDQVLIREYGYDIINLYHLFSKPVLFCDWEDGGLDGVDRFVRRLYKMLQEAISEPGCPNEEYKNIVNHLNSRIHDSMQQRKKSTIVSSFMIFFQEISESNRIDHLDLASVEEVLKLLRPYAPYVALELWEELNTGRTLFEEEFPIRKEPDHKEATDLPVQVNGRTRGKIVIDIATSEKEIIELAKKQIRQKIDFEQCNVIYVPGKIINFVLLEKDN